MKYKLYELIKFKKKIISAIKKPFPVHLTTNDIFLTNKILKILYPHIEIPDYLLDNETSDEETSSEEKNVGGNKYIKSQNIGKKNYKK
jgi:hypothetical protein